MTLTPLLSVLLTDSHQYPSMLCSLVVVLIQSCESGTDRPGFKVAQCSTVSSHIWGRILVWCLFYSRRGLSLSGYQLSLC